MENQVTNEMKENGVVEAIEPLFSKEKITIDDVVFFSHALHKTVFAKIKNRFWVTVSIGSSVAISVFDTLTETAVAGIFEINNRNYYAPTSCYDYIKNRFHPRLVELIGRICYWLHRRLPVKEIEDLQKYFCEAISQYLRERVGVEPDFWDLDFTFFTIKKEDGVIFTVQNAYKNWRFGVPKRFERFIPDAWQKTLEFLKGRSFFKNPMDMFEEIFLAQMRSMISREHDEEVVFEGKKPTKIMIKKELWFGLMFEFFVRVKASTVHGEEKEFWCCDFDDIDEAKRTFDLLVTFCRSVKKPRVFQVRSFAKQIAGSRKRNVETKIIPYLSEF